MRWTHGPAVPDGDRARLRAVRGDGRRQTPLYTLREVESLVGSFRQLGNLSKKRAKYPMDSK
jgi:hypothetical protein